MRRWALIAGVFGVTAGAWAAAVSAAAFSVTVHRELGRSGVLAYIAPRPQATLVFDRTGQHAFSFFVEQRTDVPLDRVSPHVIHAVLAVEDQRFMSHRGIDPIRIAKAAYRNFRAGRIREGASTITQQLARVTQLTRERSYERKMREVLIAVRLEQKYTKDRILEEYLNTVYFGQGYYGVEAAARGYFGKSAADLLPAEAALVAALARSPSVDAPGVAPDRALSRRNLVLRLMRAQGRLSDAELRIAIATPLPDRPKAVSSDVLSSASATGLYFQEELRRELFDRFGPERVLRGGLRVYSTYDPGLQRAAERAIGDRVAQIAKIRRAARDLQAALVAMDPRSGEVLALVGGRDFRASSFNRATQARRQAGSAFKPIIYAAALERGYAPGTLLRDLSAPIATGAEPWLPGGDHERPEYTLRRALKVSSNRAAAQLLHEVGVSTAVHFARRLGIASELPMVPSLALGTGEVTLIELTAAYSAFANGGMVTSPRLMTRVEDATGAVIWHAQEHRVRAISPATAYLMSSMLSDVVSGGTGAAARAHGFRLPAAGKTGTTDDYADAWFIGYTPRLLTGVWFGLDRPAPIMRDGYASVVAVPAWARFMRDATHGARPEWYAMPPDIERVAICPLSGARASDACRNAAASGARTIAMWTPAPGPLEVYDDLFPVGSVPADMCGLHEVAPHIAAGTLAAAATPHADAALGRSRERIDGAIERIRARSRLIVERVSRPDGSVRIVIREH